VFNRAYDRTGTLFEGPFGRKPVTSDAYFVWLVAYIHQNPQKHGMVSDFRDWPFSSYHAHFSRLPTRLKRDEVLAWFDGQAGFVASHERWVDHRQVAALAPEDFDWGAASRPGSSGVKARAGYSF
jgi:putative transposase